MHNNANAQPAHQYAIASISNLGTTRMELLAYKAGCSYGFLRAFVKSERGVFVAYLVDYTNGRA